VSLSADGVVGADDDPGQLHNVIEFGKELLSAVPHVVYDAFRDNRLQEAVKSLAGTMEKRRRKAQNSGCDRFGRVSSWPRAGARDGACRPRRARWAVLVNGLNALLVPPRRPKRATCRISPAVARQQPRHRQPPTVAASNNTDLPSDRPRASRPRLREGGGRPSTRPSSGLVPGPDSPAPSTTWFCPPSISTLRISDAGSSIKVIQASTINPQCLSDRLNPQFLSRSSTGSRSSTCVEKNLDGT